MAKQLACGELMPGCKFVAKAPSEAEVLKQAATHAAQVHGIKDMTPDLVKKVKSLIRDVA